MCGILGVQVPNLSNLAHYVSLDHSLHPMVRESESAIETYDAAELPLYTEVMLCLSKANGIKGVSILSNLK